MKNKQQILSKKMDELEIAAAKLFYIEKTSENQFLIEMIRDEIIKFKKQYEQYGYTPYEEKQFQYFYKKANQYIELLNTIKDNSTLDVEKLYLNIATC